MGRKKTKSRNPRSDIAGSIFESPEHIAERVTAGMGNKFAAMSPAEYLADLDPRDRKEWLSTLDERELQALEYHWNFWARPKQRPIDSERKTFLMAGRGFGKGLRASTPIPTSRGFKPIGELEVGDVLFSENGEPCRVTAVYPQGPKQMYRFWFSDNSYLDADDSHLWATWTHRDRKKYLGSNPGTCDFPEDWAAWEADPVHLISEPRLEEVMALSAAGMNRNQISKYVGMSYNTVSRFLGKPYVSYAGPAVATDGYGPRRRSTLEILDSLRQGGREDLNHCIPTCRPLSIEAEDLPLDPYIAGYFLGDGCRADGCIAVGREDADWVVRVLADWSPQYSDSGGVVRTKGLLSALKSSGLLSQDKSMKLVPHAFLWASEDQRLAMLQGLMDSDGYCGKNSHVEFCNKDKDIAAAVYHLAVSLGQKPRMLTGEATLGGTSYGTKYRVVWRPTIQVFRLPRKAARVKLTGSQMLRNRHRMIVDIEKLDIDESVCITVDSQNRLFLAGEQMVPTSNSRTAAETVRHWIESGLCRHVAMIAPTARDLRKVMVEDIYTAGSGIMQVCPPWNKPHYSHTAMRLTWVNPNYKSYGASASLYTAEEPGLLRGPAHDGAWIDELARMDKQEEVWDMLMFNMRLGKDPRIIITTTPAPTPFMQWLLGYVEDETRPKAPKFFMITGSTYENQANLASEFIEDISAYEGTTLGRQELYGEMLTDIEGAIWSTKMLEDNRLPRDTQLPPIRRRVVGVDPQMTNTKRSMTGIVVCSVSAKQKGSMPKAYVEEDASMGGTPREWAETIVRVYHKWDCNAVVIEVNQGGELCRDNILNVDPTINVIMVRATKSKGERAIPVAAKYEIGAVKHLGVFRDLENEMLTYIPGDPANKKRSPNRMDAMVHALDHLIVSGRRAGIGIAIKKRI